MKKKLVIVLIVFQVLLDFLFIYKEGYLTISEVRANNIEKKQANGDYFYISSKENKWTPEPVRFELAYCTDGQGNFFTKWVLVSAQ